jgi:4-carboxymuconolactone decarboxylase
MSQTARFQETLRRLAMIDETFVEDQARIGLGQAWTLALDPRTASLLQLGASVAIGAPSVCVEWSAGRAVAAGASDDEIADVLLAIAPVAGLARVVCAAPDVATAPGYDVAGRAGRPGRLRRAPHMLTAGLPAARGTLASLGWRVSDRPGPGHRAQSEQHAGEVR